MHAGCNKRWWCWSVSQVSCLWSWTNLQLIESAGCKQFAYTSYGCMHSLLGASITCCMEVVHFDVFAERTAVRRQIGSFYPIHLSAVRNPRHIFASIKHRFFRSLLRNFEWIQFSHYFHFTATYEYRNRPSMLWPISYPFEWRKLLTIHFKLCS